MTPLTPGLDAEQVRLLHADRVILVSETDEPVGEASKLDSHISPGLLHRAFSVLLFDTRGRLLVQQRADTKVTFPLQWANTCCSHPLANVPGESEGVAGAISAACRRLQLELGITSAGVAPHDLHFLGRLRYAAPSHDQWAENEVDYILAAVVPADTWAEKHLTAVNTNEVAAVRWISLADFDALNALSDADFCFTPWFKHIVGLFRDRLWSPLESRARREDFSEADSGSQVAELAAVFDTQMARIAEIFYA
jgi:isopentenyl-diphosphate delta-isomerase